AIAIIGTDINRESLARAQEGGYGARAVRTVPPPLLEKYFDRANDRYLVKPAVKSLVQFQYHNLVKDPCVPMGLAEFDVVFCRNVTIYFNLETTKSVANRLYGSLVPGGYLFIGHAETLWQISDRYRVVEYPQTFFYQRPAAGMAPDATAAQRPCAPLPAVPLRPPEPRPAASAEAERAQTAFERAAQAYQRKAYEDALTQFEQLCRQHPNLLRAYYMRGMILANQGRYESAAAVLQELLGRDNLYGEAYFLLGVLYQKLGELDLAVSALEKVIYIDSMAALAHYLLGELHRARRQPDKARHHYRAALRALGHRPEDDIVGYSEDMTVGTLMRACRRQLEEPAPPAVAEPMRQWSKPRRRVS
ncbi:MAG: CheR family methyltransferase, partial [Nitrospirota bacterium]